MAVDISTRFLETLRFPRVPHLHLLITGRVFIRAWRRLLRAVLPYRAQGRALPKPTLADSVERSAMHYQEHLWAFANPFIDEKFYRELVGGWPPRYYLDPPREITKSYDIGFKWIRGWDTPPGIERFPALHALFNYFQSYECGERLTKMIGSSVPIAFNTFLVNVTYPGSVVIPHHDTPLPAEAQPFVNVVYFVDGAGGGNSGELMLSRDNELKKVEFLPPTLKNAAIIYDTRAPFYHGFDKVAWGKWRWAITASFSRADYRGPQKI